MHIKTTALSLFVTVIFTTTPASAGNDSGSSSGWTGQYVGAALGASYEMADPELNEKRVSFFTGGDNTQTEPEGSKSLSELAVNGGLLWGINRQKGKLFYGIEVDITASSFSESRSTGKIDWITSPGNTFELTTKVSSDWAASLRPRLGLIDGDRLYYGTIGPSLMKLNYDFNFSETAFNESASISESKIVLGMTAGFGVTQKLQSGWSIRPEYLFSYYKNAINEDSRLVNFQQDGFSHDMNHMVHNFRIALVKSF